MKKLISILIIQLAAYSLYAQSARLQGDIILRIAQHISWPVMDSEYKFIIGVIGSEADFQALQRLAAEKKTIHNYPIEVRYFKCTDKISECNLVYVSGECRYSIDKIVKVTKTSPVLVISNQPGYATRGSIINFVESEGKVSIELNEEQALKRGLEVSAALREIAVAI